MNPDRGYIEKNDALDMLLRVINLEKNPDQNLKEILKSERAVELSEKLFNAYLHDTKAEFSPESQAIRFLLEQNISQQNWINSLLVDKYAPEGYLIKLSNYRTNIENILTSRTNSINGSNIACGQFTPVYSFSLLKDQTIKARLTYDNKYNTSIWVTYPDLEPHKILTLLQLLDPQVEKLTDNPDCSNVTSSKSSLFIKPGKIMELSAIPAYIYNLLDGVAEPNYSIGLYGELSQLSYQNLVNKSKESNPSLKIERIAALGED